MRILILSIILTLFTINLSAQNYEFREWPYPCGPPLGGYNDSILGEYNENKDIILEFEASEHSLCEIRITERYLKFYKLKPYWIYKIEVLNVFWSYKSFNVDEIKKNVFCTTFFKNKYSKNTVFIGTFSVNINHLVLQKKLSLEKNITYYISQKIVIINDKKTHNSKIINELIENQK